MMSIANHVAIVIETPMINSGWSLEKEFTKLICMNPLMVLCQSVNHVDSCRDYVHGPLT